jgi:hypothetical protein
MDEQEVEVVAEELAKAGGVSWHPGRTTEPVLRTVHARYRDRARLAIAALERWRARQSGPAQSLNAPAEASLSPPSLIAGQQDGLQVGAVVIYRAPGDKRAIPCRVEKLEKGRAYLVPCPISEVGWVDLDTLRPLSNEPAPDEA